MRGWITAKEKKKVSRVQSLMWCFIRLSPLHHCFNDINCAIFSHRNFVETLDTSAMIRERRDEAPPFRTRYLFFYISSQRKKRLPVCYELVLLLIIYTDCKTKLFATNRSHRYNFMFNLIRIRTSLEVWKISKNAAYIEFSLEKEMQLYVFKVTFDFCIV